MEDYITQAISLNQAIAMEKMLEVITNKAVMICDECKEGHMCSTGEVYMTNPAQYAHMCNKCGYRTNYFTSYPNISYQDRGQGKLNTSIMDTQSSKPPAGGNFGLPDNDKIKLPSSLQPGQVGRLQFPGMENYIAARINRVHFSVSTVTYDLVLWFHNGDETRIYNVDSMYITPA